MHHKKNSTAESRSFTAQLYTIEVMNLLNDESNDRSQRLTKQAALTTKRTAKTIMMQDKKWENPTAQALSRQ